MVELYLPTAAPPPPFKFCQKFPRIGAQFLLNDSTSFLDILIWYSETKSDLSDFCPREQEKEERVSGQVILAKPFWLFQYFLDLRLELRCQKVEGERERWRAKCLELEETNRQLQVEIFNKLTNKLTNWQTDKQTALVPAIPFTSENGNLIHSW